MDPDRNLGRSEIRPNLVRKPARPDVIDRHGERFAGPSFVEERASWRGRALSTK